MSEYKKSDNTRRRNVKLKRLAGGKCSACGYDKNFAALDFHHTDPTTKLFTVGSQKRTMHEKVSEAKKCILLCRNCHAELHNPQYESGLFDQIFISTDHPSWHYSREEYASKLFDPDGLLTLSVENDVVPNKQGVFVVERCREQVLRMHERGLHRDTIARRCGISISTVYKICRQAPPPQIVIEQPTQQK